MEAKQLDIEQFDLRNALDLIQDGAEVVITRDDVPIARLISMKEKKRTPGLHEGKIRTSDDFNAPLDDSFLFGEP